MPAGTRACAVAVLFLCAPAFAMQDRAEVDSNEPLERRRTVSWKLTPTVHRESAGRAAYDLNLRGNTEKDTFWFGNYRRGGEFEQSRAGYERQFALPFGRVIASIQHASHGFWGGSVTLEAGPGGSPLTGLFGWGRTNLKPYYNLNFDPNDSVVLGASWKPGAATALMLFRFATTGWTPSNASRTRCCAPALRPAGAGRSTSFTALATAMRGLEQSRSARPALH